MIFRKLSQDEINEELFSGFIRRQEVTKCYRPDPDSSGWCIVPIAFTDDWGAAEYAFLIECLRGTLAKQGAVFGAFEDSRLCGFASVEAEKYGTNGQYRDLTSLHVTADMRRSGIGGALFELAAAWAASQGAQKLYISAHSAVETQLFYRSIGCVDAEEPLNIHSEQEPNDCQLEYVL